MRIENKTVYEIGTTYDLIEGAPNRTLESAILIMGMKKFRRLPITKLGKIKGILTVTDIIRAIAVKGLPEAYDEKISDWMTLTPHTVNADTTVVEATRMMVQGGFGSLLITDPDNPEILKGIVTERDILHLHTDETWDNKKISDLDDKLIKKGLSTVHQKESLEEAIRKMDANKTHRILTVDDNQKLVGILTANDITSLSSREREEIHENKNFLKSIDANYVSTTNILTAKLDTQVSEAISIMRENNIGSLPILDNDQIVGVFSERSIVKMIAEM